LLIRAGLQIRPNSGGRLVRLMKVLLVNTNQMKPAIAPIGLDYLADSIISAGHEPKLLDLCFSDDISSDIKAAIHDFVPDIIGVSIRNTDDCYFSGGAFFLPGIKQMINLIKKEFDAPIILGGVGFSIAPKAIMEYCGVDYGIAGAGEQPIAQFLNAYEKNASLECVYNLLQRKNGAIVRNFNSQGEAYKHPRRRAFVNNAHYFSEGGQAGIETKCGCNMKCIYCAELAAKGSHILLRTPNLIVDEIKTLLAQGIDHFHTCDCEFNIPGNHAKEVCRAIINAGLGDKIRWYAYCSITPFDTEMADLFKRAGCAGVDFGADSGNDAMLKRLGRHFKSDDLITTAKLCHDYGIPFMYDLLIGGPDETRETVRQTIDLMRVIDADRVGVSMGVRVYQGTAMADYIRDHRPHLHGAKEDNPDFLKPVFYISPDLGDRIVSYLHELVGDDHRFFLPSNEEVESNYNYNDNTILVNAIKDGARGAYWDILRRLAK